VQPKKLGRAAGTVQQVGHNLFSRAATEKRRVQTGEPNQNRHLFLPAGSFTQQLAAIGGADSSQFAGAIFCLCGTQMGRKGTEVGLTDVERKKIFLLFSSIEMAGGNSGCPRL
jgi:hypothetical protein